MESKNVLQHKFGKLRKNSVHWREYKSVLLHTQNMLGSTGYFGSYIIGSACMP